MTGVCKFATVKAKSFSTWNVTSMFWTTTVNNTIDKAFVKKTPYIVFPSPSDQFTPSQIIRMTVSIHASRRIGEAKSLASVERMDVPFLALGSEEWFVSGEGSLEPEFNLVPVMG